MQQDHLTQARRWAKFPAVVLFCAAVVWLVQSYFELDLGRITQESESIAGATLVIFNLVVIPLGSVAAGFGLLFVQRWAIYWGGSLLTLMTLLKTFEQVARMMHKFEQFRATAPPDYSTFGNGVLTGLLILALWAACGVLLMHLYKAHEKLERATEWLHGARTTGQDKPGAGAARQPLAPDESDDFCLLLPDAEEDSLAEEPGGSKLGLQ